jgi:hypothetical protein
MVIVLAHCEYHKVIDGTKCKLDATRKTGQLVDGKLETISLCDKHFGSVVLRFMGPGTLSAVRAQSLRDVLGEV